MEVTLGGRIKKAWNAFINNEYTSNNNYYYYGSNYRPDRVRLSRGNERSIVTSVFNRISTDISLINIKHCKIDQNGKFKEIINDPLNNCLSVEANIDQTSQAFIQDAVMSMFDDGSVALVPVDTSSNPFVDSSYDILSMRVGKIVEWYPDKVKVFLYNEKNGRRENIVLLKKQVAIIENPFYSIMNEPNSTLSRLMRKLALLDTIDEETNSGKLDLIIQLPYVIKTQGRKEEAEKRRSEIEKQLSGSKYGIAYTDGTEKITQLNRPIENNLMKQIEYLTSMLYSQLGITQAVLDGTADERTMMSYYSRTIEPIISAFSLEMKRKFLTKTARSQGHDILYFKDPFKLVPVSNLADLADKFTRNEILTSNEIRGIIGFKPSDNPKADELINSNMPRPVTDTNQQNVEYGPDQYIQDVFKNLDDEDKDKICKYATSVLDNVTEKSEKGGENQNGV